MTDQDTLVFGTADWVTRNPAINGFFFHDSGLPAINILTNTSPATKQYEFESGYVNGGRFDFAGGSLPAVVFQGVRITGAGQGKLVLAIMTRFDDAFGSNDAFHLFLKTTPTAPNTDARMIEILPNTIVGANSTATVYSTNTTPPFVPPTENDWKIRTNANPEVVRFYKGRSSASPAPFNFWWDQILDTAEAALLTAFAGKIKVRSWEPTTVSNVEKAWSIEIELPIDAPAGGDWITLASQFGIYFSVRRISALTTATGAIEFANKQTYFPPNSLYISGSSVRAHDLTNPGGQAFGTPRWGTGVIPDLLPLGTPNPGRGVRFANPIAELAVGRRKAGSTGTVLTSNIYTRPNSSNPDSGDNEMVALVQNTGTSLAPEVYAEFRFRRLGLPSPQQTDWNLEPSILTNPTTPFTDIAAGATNVPLSGSWTMAAAASAPTGYADKHFCMWVQLNSKGGGVRGVNFIQSSVRRNIDFDRLSEITRKPVVSGQGYPKPADGSNHRFLLQTHARLIPWKDWSDGLSAKRPGDQPFELDSIFSGLIASVGGQKEQQPLDADPDRRRDSVDDGGDDERPRNKPVNLPDAMLVLWITQGFRYTGDFLEIDGQQSEILDPSPGAFGFYALHEGLNDAVSWTLSGPDVTWIKPGTLELQVPVDGEVELDLTLAASRDGLFGDQSPRYPDGPKGAPVKVDPRGLEWSAEDDRDRQVNFAIANPSWAERELRLEIAPPASGRTEEFRWASGTFALAIDEPFVVNVSPPQGPSPADRSDSLRYRVIDRERVVDEGTIRLRKLRTNNKPSKPDRFPFDLMSLIRRLFQSFFSFITRERQ
jgi:hypothetical protein